MARKDEILKSFLNHELISEKYEIDPGSLPNSVTEALDSPIPIVKAMALIIEHLEPHHSFTDKGLRNLINQYLNEAAI
jgi:hypothetical protein